MCSIGTTSSYVSGTKTSENLSEFPEKTKQTISLLPREKGISAFELIQYQAFWFPSFYMENIILAQEKFHPKQTDIFICSILKTGTTWLKALCFAIYTRANYPDSSNPLITSNPHECMPLLERDIVQILSKRDEDGGSILPLISTHIPYSSLPKSIIHEGCKIIYICRDPKDTFISLWHYINKIRKRKGIELIPIKEALDLFSKGLSAYGSFWNHVLGYWNASLENVDKVLFLKYEDMMKDTGASVKKLANFMGCPFSTKEEMGGIIDKIVCMCSFSNISNLEVNKNGKGDFLRSGHHIEYNIFFRKGEIGDWKNYLAQEDAAYVDAITKEKFQGSGLTELFAIKTI